VRGEASRNSSRSRSAACPDPSPCAREIGAEDRRLCPILAPRSDRAGGSEPFPPKSSFNQSQGVVDIKNGRQERLENRTSEIFNLSFRKT
jgi:hypothetical protein